MTVAFDTQAPQWSGRRSGQTSREQLLDVAAQLFAQKGLQGVTLSEIAGAAGMSGPAIYNHFASKNALFSEVVCRMYDEEVVVFAAVLDPLDSVQDGLRQLLATVPKMYRGEGVMQQLGLTAQLEAVRDPGSFTQIAAAIRRRDDIAIRLVQRAQRAGEVPANADAQEFGSLLIALFVGALGYRSLRAPKRGQFAHTVQTYQELFGVLQRGRTVLPAAKGRRPRGLKEMKDE